MGRGRLPIAGNGGQETVKARIQHKDHMTKQPIIPFHIDLNDNNDTISLTTSFHVDNSNSHTILPAMSCHINLHDRLITIPTNK